MFFAIICGHGKKIIEHDPDRAAVIILIFEWYDTDNYSIEAITEKAAEAGLVSRHGNRVSKSNIHCVLRKRIYTGDFDWNGNIYRGSHKPLISHELFERVQAKLDGRFQGREKKANRNFTFSGLVKCGHCGCALVGELKKGRYIYYHCTGRKCKCDEPYTREEILEEQFGGYLKNLSSTMKFSTGLVMPCNRAMRTRSVTVMMQWRGCAISTTRTGIASTSSTWIRWTASLALSSTRGSLPSGMPNRPEY
jgi:hypothetical protein